MRSNGSNCWVPRPPVATCTCTARRHTAQQPLKPTCLNEDYRLFQCCAAGSRPKICAWQAPPALEQVHGLQSPSSAASQGHCWHGMAHRVTIQHSRGRAPSCMSSPGERSPKHCKKSHFKGSALSLPADALAVSIRPPAPWGGLTSAASGAAPAAQRLSLSARQGRTPAGAPVISLQGSDPARLPPPGTRVARALSGSVQRLPYKRDLQKANGLLLYLRRAGFGGTQASLFRQLSKNAKQSFLQAQGLECPEAASSSA